MEPLQRSSSTTSSSEFSTSDAGSRSEEHTTISEVAARSLNAIGLNKFSNVPPNTPYLGENAREPTIGFRRKVTIKMQNLRRKLLPSYSEKANPRINTGDNPNLQSYINALGFCKNFPYNNDDQRQYGGDNPMELSAALGNTLERSKDVNYNTSIELTYGDSVINAKKLSKQGETLGIVNCANKDRLGGVWDIARGSQEESLFRQSNLYAALKSAVETFRRDKRNHIPAAGVILNPKVNFVDPDEKNSRFFCDVVSVAAIDYSKHKTRQRSEIAKAAKKAGISPEEFLKQATKNKYAAMFGAFLDNGNKDLLISLPGVGSFKNPPDMVIEILKELLIEDGAPFKGKFEKITFNVFREGDATDLALKSSGILTEDQSSSEEF